MLLDTNCLLRYLIGDVPEQQERVASLILEGASTVPECLAECVFVLSGRVYDLSREETSQALLELLKDVECEHHQAMVRALELFAGTTLDFVDCDLVARNQVESAPIVTFDKKMERLLGKTA